MPVPEPVADVLLAWIDNRTNMNTSTNRGSRWLFPGRRAGQPMHPDSLGGLVKALGVSNVQARTSAMRQHVQQMPAPVVADALGYHPATTTKLAAEAVTRALIAENTSVWGVPQPDASSLPFASCSSGLVVIRVNPSAQVLDLCSKIAT